MEARAMCIKSCTSFNDNVHNTPFIEIVTSGDVILGVAMIAIYLHYYLCRRVGMLVQEEMDV
jgi:hypothetical protein